MRLQNLIIIFVVIALPVIIILSIYVRLQVDTANLRTDYDNIFFGATQDMLLAFQLNTTNNKYSTIADSLIRDIDASINAFTSTFESSFKYMGTSKKTVLEYVPAIVFTFNDGYYIYTPSVDSDGNLKHALKPYVFYSKEYIDGNKKIIINFSLDNYVSVCYYDGDTYESRADYLELIANSSSGDGVYVEIDNGKRIVYYNGIKIEEKETLKRNTFENRTCFFSRRNSRFL